MTSSFEVHPYTINTLEALLADKSRADSYSISTKSHRNYFERYFNHLSAKTIVVEDDYVDRDFLDDFAEYYVRCFSPYKRTCARLHFFDLGFSKQDLQDFLSGNNTALNEETLQNSYLGFVVVKPLPKTVIGRTCLKTYPESAGGREYPITRPYSANLFGIHLTVDTLAFQEQDSVTAACATSALWSAFHGTGRLFQHPILSPVEITKAATALSPLDTRTLPDTHGLTLGQMAHAIRSVGLEPFLVNISDDYVLKGTLYAYLKGHVPVLMGIQLVTEADPSYAPVTHRLIDGHAVAVAGYNLGISDPDPYGSTGFLLRAARIDRIYAHDDQVGPFARMLFDGTSISLGSKDNPRQVPSTSWGGTSAAVSKIRAVPFVVLIPLYHKIRIPFERVHDVVVPFDSLVEDLRSYLAQQGANLLPGRLEWDIYLTTVNDFKSSILHGDDVSGEYRLDLLAERLPRFLWRATAYSTASPIVDLLFDATDIEQGAFFTRAVEYHRGLSSVLRAITKESTLVSTFRQRPDWSVIEWFKNQPVS